MWPFITTMGKLRFNLSHVMPHVWFYKLREMGKSGRRVACSQHPRSSRPHYRAVLASSQPDKQAPSERICSSPINHKALDIAFPETPRRSAQSSLIPMQCSIKGAEIYDMKDAILRTGADSCNPSATNCLCTSAESGLAEGAECLLGLGNLEKCSNFTLLEDKKSTKASAKCIDPRELERRLHSLSFEERKRYCSSPNFSAGMPSPIQDEDCEETLPLLNYSYGDSIAEDETLTLHQARSSNVSSCSCFRTSTLFDGLEIGRSSTGENDASIGESIIDDLEAEYPPVTKLRKLSIQVDKDHGGRRIDSEKQQHKSEACDDRCGIQHRKGSRRAHNTGSFCYNGTKERLLSGKVEIDDRKWKGTHRSRKRSPHFTGHQEIRAGRSHNRHYSGKVKHQKSNEIVEESTESVFDLKYRLPSHNHGVVEEGNRLYRGTLRVVKAEENYNCDADTYSRVFDSFAMVKCSYDPKQDFKDSMMEMIMEKQLYNSQELKKLLQCYLSLNSERYHDTIVSVFTEVSSGIF